MLARIVACLDVKHGQVVKGTKFRNHEVIGDVLALAKRYSDEGADEIVVYDIAASSENKTVDKSWVKAIASVVKAPLCIAGGIRTLKDAKEILNNGARKISINSPALANPGLIEELATHLGKERVVIGIDSYYDKKEEDYFVYTLTGDETLTNRTKWRTLEWVKEVEALGAGEIVLNMMNQDGVREGYDIPQLQAIKKVTTLPIIASGGAGKMEHFLAAYKEAKVEGTLGASAFHKEIINIKTLKTYLKANGVSVLPGDSSN